MEEPRPGKRQVRDALKALTDAGEAVREGAGKRGNPYRWKVPGEAEGIYLG